MNMVAAQTNGWYKRVGIVLLGLLFGLAMIIATLLAVFDEEDYKRVLVWSVEYLLDSELVIKGPLSVQYSEGVLLAADAFQLKAKDDSFLLDAHTFKLQFPLAPMFSGGFWIHDLTIEKLVLKFHEIEDASDSDVFVIPPVVIARAKIDSLQVEYQELLPGTLHIFSLDDLVIGDANADGPVEVQATGMFKGQAFKLDGVLPPLDKIQDTVTPKPLKLVFLGEKITVSLDGTITDPLNGEGLDLKLMANAEGVEKYLEIFGDDIPSLGRLDITALLRGDYDSPRLDDIDLKFSSDEHIGLEVRGEIADIMTGEGAKLQITGQSDNPAVLSWLLFKQQDRLSSISLKAVLEINDARYMISGLDVNAETPEGLTLLLSGAGEIFSAGHQISKTDAGFTITVKAPKTSIFTMLGRRDFPDLGPVSGAASMALGIDVIGLYDADVSIGRRQGSHLSLQGDIGSMSLSAGGAISGTNLQAYITTMNLAKLGKQLDHEWPDFGRVELIGDLNYKMNELRLDQAKLKVGDPKQPSIKAQGSLSSELNKGTTIDLDLEVVVAELVAALSQSKPERLGRLHGSTRISDKDGSWGIEAISLESSDTPLYQLKVSGHYDDLENFDQGNIKISASVDDMAALGNEIGSDLSMLGSYRAEGLLLGNNGKLSYRGSSSLGGTSSTAEIEGSLVDGKPHFTGKLVMPVLQTTDFGFVGDENMATVESVAPTKDSNYVFSRKPLDTSFLNNFNLELDLAIDEVVGVATSIDSVDGHISVLNGRLSVKPLQLNFADGRSSIVVEVQDAAVPEYKIKVISDNVKLGSLLAQVDGDVPVVGYSNVHMDLEAKGRSMHELAASLNGVVKLGLENARIPRKYITLLSADVLGWVGSKAFMREKYTNLNCVVLSFESRNGMVESKTIIADGPRLSLGGRINLDLNKEMLDIVILPKEKKRVFSSISPVKITGAMQNPKVEAIPAKAAIQEIGTMALLPGAAISVKVLEKLWELLDAGDKLGGGCATLGAVSDAAEEKMQQAE